ncbi:MAG: hypothetical protein A2X75_05215 [Gallionellales bacterium GWE2_58_10]|nr:MAG: hypothetical protein A2X75_05215 [Gallionellales bacterium GWE2_58_10]
MHIDYNVLLDATQDDCPIPTIRTKEMLDEMAAGTVLKVVTSKEGTIRNIRTFVNSSHCELVCETRATEGFHFYIRKL